MSHFTIARKIVSGGLKTSLKNVIVKRHLANFKATKKQVNAFMSYALEEENIASLKLCLQGYSNNGAQTIWDNITVEKNVKFRLDLQGPYTDDNWGMGANLNVQSGSDSCAAIKIPFNGATDQQPVGIRNPSVDDDRINLVLQGMLTSLQDTGPASKSCKVFQVVLPDFPI